MSRVASQFIPEQGALLWELLCVWYQAEAEMAADPIRFPPLHAAPVDTIIRAATQRVIDVITGEVCWSNTTPGDRAVWVMRTRMNPDEVSLLLRRQRNRLEGDALDYELEGVIGGSDELAEVDALNA